MLSHVYFCLLFNLFFIHRSCAAMRFCAILVAVLFSEYVQIAYVRNTMLLSSIIDYLISEQNANNLCLIELYCSTFWAMPICAKCFMRHFCLCCFATFMLLHFIPSSLDLILVVSIQFIDQVLVRKLQCYQIIFHFTLWLFQRYETNFTKSIQVHVPSQCLVKAVQINREQKEYRDRRGKSP